MNGRGGDLGVMASAGCEGTFQRVPGCDDQEGPQVVSDAGVKTAVMVPIEEWERLQKAARPGLKEWLLAPEPRCDDSHLRERQVAQPSRGGVRVNQYLLDTNVISELRKVRPHGAVIAWLGAMEESRLFVSAVTLGELQVGIERTRRHDPAKASELEGWIDRLPASYQVLPMDTAASGNGAALWIRSPLSCCKTP